MLEKFDMKKYKWLIAGISTALALIIVFTSLAVSGTLDNLFRFSGGTDISAQPTTIISGGEKRPDDDQSQIAFQRPEYMNGAWLSAGTDYYIRKNETYNEVCTQIDNAMKSAVEFGMNSLMVPLNIDDKSVYSKGNKLDYIYKTDKKDNNDVFSYITKKAKASGLMVYAVYRLGALNIDPGSEINMSGIIDGVKKVILNYDFSGIIFDDYYFKKYDTSYGSYIKSAAFNDYSEYKYALTQSLISRAVVAAKKSGSGIYAGVLCDPVYARLVKNDKGVAADENAFQAYYDGCFDILSVLDKNIIDFAVVNGYGSTKDESARFDYVAKWWTDVCKEHNIDVYFSLSATSVGMNINGWNDPNELLNELKILKKHLYRGFVVNSIKRFSDDKTGSTANVVKFIGEEVGNDVVFSSLKLVSPSSDRFTTYENSVVFLGASDPNYPMNINSKEVKRSENGYFSLEYSLKAGKNSFELEHKGIKKTVMITYKTVILKQINPTTDQTAAGESTVTVNAVAKKDAVLSVKLGSTVKSMIAQETESEYANYYATITLPAAKKAVQPLGEIMFTAKLSGHTETMAGGNFTVQSADKSANTISTFDSSKYSSDEIKILDTTNVLSNGSNTIAQVIIDQAETLKGEAADDRSRPVYNFLPKGTIDYCSANEILNYENGKTIKYRKLNSGVRVYSNDDYNGDNVRILKGKLPDSNNIVLSSSKINGRHTLMTFDVSWKAPFLVEYLPQKYKKPDSTTSRPDYSVTSLTYTYVDITFKYAKSAQGKVDLSSNPLFKSMEWIRDGDNYKLRLYLKNKGCLYGFTADYDKSGNFTFSFLNPAKIKKSNNEYGYSLEGRLIMLDAGHGGSDPGAIGSNSNYTEAKLNLMLATMLKSELEKTGASVVMTRTSERDLTLAQRTAMIRKFMPDIFVSIHRNASSSAAATGFDDYYYYPFSKPLASFVFNQGNKVFDGRKVNYYPFYVTRVTECPSILTENGFVSNANELNNLIKTDFNKKTAKALAQGIVDYFKNMK